MSSEGSNHLLSRLAFFGLLLILLLAPFPMGSDRPWAWNILQIAILAVSMVLVAMARRSFPCFSRLRQHRIPLVCFGLFSLYPFLQATPMPLDWLVTIAPAHADWFTATGLSPRHGFLSAEPYASWVAARKGLVNFLAFALVLILVDSRRRLVWLVITLVSAGVLESLHGILSHFMADDFPFWRPQWLGHAWATGTFVNKNHYAAHLSMALCLMAGLTLAHLGGRSESSGGGVTARLNQAAGMLLDPVASLRLVVLVILLAAFLLAQSRGAALGLMSGIVVSQVVTRLFNPEQRFSTCLWLGMAGLLVFAMALMGATGMLERLLAGDVTDSTRWLLWRQSLAIFFDYPLWGVGAGAYETLITAYKVAEMGIIYFDFAHNDHLQLLVEEGVLGALLFWGLVLSAFPFRYRAGNALGMDRCLFGGVRIAVLAFIAHGLVDFNFHIPANSLWFYSLLGIACLLRQRR